MSRPKASGDKAQISSAYAAAQAANLADDDAHHKLLGIEASQITINTLPETCHDELRTVLPTKDDGAFALASAEIAHAMETYRALAGNRPRPRRRQEIRDHLSYGGELARTIAQQNSALAKWIGTIDNEVRDFLLGGLRIGGHTLRQFKELLEAEAEVMNRTIVAGFDTAIYLVQKRQGRRGNPELQLLVRWLAKIWEEYTGNTFSRTRKGKIRPRDFVVVVCRHADKTISEPAIENALKEVITARRGEKS
jgi:hypothetical protein